MAINDAIPGLEVTITHEDEALTEYDDNAVTEEALTTTRYIESQSGQTFAVRFEVEEGTRFRGDCLACEITIDGSSVDTPLLEKSKCRDRALVSTRKGCRTRTGKMKSFMFSGLEVGTFNPAQCTVIVTYMYDSKR